MKSTHETNFDTAYVIGHFIEKKGINKGCKYVAKQLNYRWVWKHIYNVYRGAKPSKKLENALQLLMKPKKKRYRMITEALSKEQYDSWPKSMEERRKRLDRKD